LRISGLIWLEEIVEKIKQKHNVSQDEVREVYRNSLHFRFVEKVITEARMCTQPWAKPMLVAI
jgi:hypothetical protein